MAFSPKTLITLDVIAVLLCFFGFEQTRQKAGVPVTFGNVGAATVVEFSQTGGISAGDTLVAIGATPVVSKLHAEHCFDEYRVGQSVSLHLKNRSEIRRIDVKTTYFYSDMYLTIQVLVGSIFFSLGVLAVYRRRTERAAIVFHWFMVTIAIVTMITWGNYAAFDYGAGVVMRMLYPALYALLGALFLHFSLIFPLPKLRARSVVLTVLYIVTGLLAGLSAAAELLYIQGVAGFSLAEQTLSWCGWYAAATSLFAVTSFLLHFRYAREESERRKLLWILFGASISVTGYFGLRLIPELLYLGAVIPEEAGLLLAVVAPVTFAIAIIKYRALDIELIINRSTVYGTVFFILLMIYALVEIVVFDYLDNIPKGMYIVISCAVVVVDIALFDPTRGMIQTFVDKRFFRVRYNFRTEQKKLTEDIKHALDSFRLSELVVGRIFTLIPTEYLAFVITENTGANVLSRYSKKGATYPHDEHCSLLGDELFRALALPSAVESGADVAEVQSPSLRRGEIVAVVPMYSESGAVLGCIAAGEKMAGTRYSLEDIDLLTTAAEQSALMLERFTLQEKLLFKFAEAKRLEELNRLKSLFVAGVTHELKTPLTSIKMFAELLRYAPDDTSKKTEYLEIIEGEADRLTRLINTVLDFSKVEHGVKEYNVTQCLFNDIAKRTISSMMYQVSMLGFHLAVHYDPQELVISADPDAIAEIIINLLSNAMKYSGQNKRIIFSTFSTPKTAGISVQDFGVGMSEETQKNIFQPYFRANDAEVQKTAGAGLGLSLVRHITDAHNATIRVESEPGKGSTFSVLFPRINNETNSDN